MLTVIDNYDSFVHTLADYFIQRDQEIDLQRSDAVNVKSLVNLAKQGKLDGIVLSPGPKDPSQAGQCIEVVQTFQRLAQQTGLRVPILGVCLGHQVIAQANGATVGLGPRPMHGKITRAINNGKGLFCNLPPSFNVTRYHSLQVQREGLPPCLRIDAFSDDGAIMALRHVDFPIYGVQYHPEAVLTEYGHELIGNFLQICQEVRA